MRVSFPLFPVLTGLDSCLELRLYTAAKASGERQNQGRGGEDGGLSGTIRRMSNMGLVSFL